jgi:hypothetical protein
MRNDDAPAEALKDEAKTAKVTARSKTPLYALIGIAFGLAIALVVLRVASKATKTPPAPPPSEKLAGRVLQEDDGALDVVLVHYVPKLEPLVADAYKDFLGTLDPSTKVVAVVPKEDAGKGAADAFRAFLAKVDSSGALAARTRFVEVGGPISVWSKDRALVLAPVAAGDRTGLAIPAPPDPRWAERANDWRTLAAVASAMPESYYVHELPLDFDAGDFAVTRDHVIIDDNLWVKNKARGFDTPEALRKVVERLFARPTIMLGSADGDVPRHHLSMYLTPIGDHIVLVGDPRAARDVVGESYEPGERNPDRDEPLRADFGDAMIARFDRAAKELAAAGYRVVRVPNVPFDDKTYFAYTNGVYETRAGKRIAWVPMFDVPKLDEAGRRAYEMLGWEVRPVRARVAFPFHGTIGCLVNVLARSG